MFLRLTLPTGNTIDCDIIRNSYVYTEVFHNELKPADSSVKLQVPFSVEVSNALKSFVNENIGAVVYGDDAMPVFTGYVRKESSMTKMVRNVDIAIELVPPSFMIDVLYDRVKVFTNKSVAYIINEVFSDMDIGLNVIDMPSREISFCSLNEKTKVKDFVTSILFECGYVYSFTADGKMKAVYLFDRKPELITQVFADGDSGNMYGSYSVSNKERSTDSIIADFNEIAYRENQILFDDTNEKSIMPGEWFNGSENGQYLTYDCNGVQSVLHVNSASAEIGRNIDAAEISFTNYYSKGLLTIRNASASQVLKISRIKVTGSGWFVISTSQSKTSEGKKSKEIKLSYTFDKGQAEELVKNVANYYKYSGVKLRVSSYADFAVGSFCKVNAEGTGEYTCRIIKKSHVLTSDMVDYEMESVLDYVPATSTTENEIGSNTGNVLESLVSPAYVSPIEKQGLKRDTVVIHDEYLRLKGDATALNILSSIEYAAFDLAHTNLELFIDESGIFNDMSVSSAVDRESLNNVFTDYYAARDNLSDKVTRVYVESQQTADASGSVPVIDISAVVIKSTETGYEPSTIQFSGRFTNGTVSVPYKSIFEVYVNNETTPAYKSVSAELTGSFTIPEATYALRCVMNDATGNTIYDNETVGFVNAGEIVSSYLDNEYQSFYPGFVDAGRASDQPFFETTVHAYEGTEEKPVFITGVTGSQGITTRTENDKLYITPESDVSDIGTITISSKAELINGTVLGLGDIVIGLDNEVFGDMKFSETLTNTFTFSNIEVDEAREDIYLYTGRYRGPVSSEFQLPVVHNKDYILWVGYSTDKFKKGHVYQYNGIFWEEDFSNEHQVATLDSMLTLFDGTENEEFFAKAFVEKLVANKAFINSLFANIITISKDGAIASEDYQEGVSGFALKNVNVEGKYRGFLEVTDGVFRGNIETGPLYLSNGSPGEETIETTEGLKYDEFLTFTRGRGFMYSSYPTAKLVQGDSVYNGYSYTIEDEIIDSQEITENRTIAWYLNGSYNQNLPGVGYITLYKITFVLGTRTYNKNTIKRTVKLTSGNTVIFQETKSKIVYANINVDLHSVTVTTLSPSGSADGYFPALVDGEFPDFSVISPPISITYGQTATTMLLRNLPDSVTSTMVAGSVWLDSNGFLRVKR